jgi:SAM-dependent methyltransferase
VEREALRQFEALAADHWWFRGRRAVFAQLLGAHLGQTRVRRALDVGCGAGSFVPVLRRFSDEVHGIDVALPDAPFAALGSRARASADRLPFADESFDLVCLFDVLEHLDDDKRALCEAFRVLRPGGLLVASVPAYAWMYANNDRIAGHRRRYVRRGLRLLAARARLRVERLTHVNVALFPLIAPCVLALKGLERLRLFGRDPRHTNLSLPLPAWAHGLLERAFRAELALSSRFDLPFGHSLLLIARRPQAGLARRASRTRSRLAGVLRRAAA